MKPFGIALMSLLSLLALLSICLAAAPATQPSVEQENRRLRDIVADQDLQMRALKDQLARKEQELKDLRQRIPALVIPPGRMAPLIPRSPENAMPYRSWPSDQPTPKGWVPIPFNGSNYYLVPLTTEKAVEKAAEVAK